MKKILYLTNIEVPYRVQFFNGLAKECDLTVLYERRKSANRNADWAKSQEIQYKAEYLDGISIGNENSFSFSLLSWLRKDWDAIIVGCYNSKVQMMGILYMRMLGIPYILSLDGEPFVGHGMKATIKKCFLRGASAYLNAGKKSCESLCKAINTEKQIKSYQFSSLSDNEIKENGSIDCKREDFVLVVGQYFDYKGMDIAYQVACMDQSIRYKFVGMGEKTQQFLDDYGEMPENIEVIPFLQKEDLYKEYQKCACLMLPTRQECWGLVINEAASFGTPIVSTRGSGAAVEFLADEYPQYLAKSGDKESLYKCLKSCLTANNNDYSSFLKGKSKEYSIERMVKEHMNLL